MDSLWADMTTCPIFAKHAKDFGTEEYGIVDQQNKEIHYFFDTRKRLWRNLVGSSFDFDLLSMGSVIMLPCFAYSGSLCCGSINIFIKMHNKLIKMNNILTIKK